MVRAVRLNKCIRRLVLLCEKVDTSLTDERWSMPGRAGVRRFAKLVESGLSSNCLHADTQE